MSKDSGLRPEGVNEHTPTPWGATKAGSIMVDDYHQSEAIYEKGQQNLVAGCFNDVRGGVKVAEANAAFIVKAVNCHDDLVAALSALRTAASNFGVSDVYFAEDNPEVLTIAAKALERARG